MIGAVNEACAATGASHESCYAVRLAVEEATLNILNHGYGGSAGPIALRMSVHDGKIVVVITDCAPVFSPDLVGPADITSDWQTRDIGGYGWHLIRSMMDGVEHRATSEGGNELTLIRTMDRK